MREIRKEECTIGVYDLGTRKVRLKYDPELIGATFDPISEDGVAELVVGFKGDDEWASIVDNCLHEAFEFMMMEVNVVYRPNPDFSKSSGNYMYVMNHEQFAEVAARTASFLVQALPDLGRAFKDHLKKTR